MEAQYSRQMTRTEPIIFGINHYIKVERDHLRLCACKEFMQVSSELCYAQEALQRERASNSLFTNIRVTATAAAAAWRREGIAAEAREARRIRMQEFRDNAVDAPHDDTFSVSENPDRGNVDIPGRKL